MKQPIIPLIFLGIVLCSLEKPEARNITLTWQKNYGEQASILPNILHTTRDGGYLMAGYSVETFNGTANNEDVWVNKTNVSGDIVWDYKLGNANREVANEALEMPNGNVLLVGTNHSKGMGKGDIWLMCINDKGVLQWDATFGGSEADEGRCLVATQDNGYVILGTHMLEDSLSSTPNKTVFRQTLWLGKTDATGKLLWEKNFVNGNYNVGEKVIETNDGFLLIANTIVNNNSMDGWLIKTDREGNLLWSKTYGGLRWDNFQAATPTSDGNVVIAGTSYKQHINGDAWLVKIDQQGQLLWEKYIDTDFYESAVAIHETPNKHLQLVSNITLDANEGMFMVSYLNNMGNEVWTKLFADHNINKITAATLNKEGELLLCADSNKGIAPCGATEGEKNAWLLKFAEEY